MDQRAPSPPFTAKSTSRRISGAVFLCGLVIFGYRGWDGHKSLMYLDEVFFQREFNIEDSYTFPLTLVRPFSGYVHLIATSGFAAFPRVSFTHLPLIIFLFSTIVWTLSALLIFSAVRQVSTAGAGTFAALAFCLLPASNIILLSQLNALQWPLLTAALIASCVGFRPRPGWPTYLYCLFLVFTALSAALMFVVVLALAASAWRVRSRISFVVFGLTSASFSIQVAAYIAQRVTNRGRPIDALSLNHFVAEWSYIYKTLLPGAMRGSVSDGLSTVSLIVLTVLTVILIFTIVFGLRVGSALQRQATDSIKLMVPLGLATGLASVAMNGNLNHQYLMIPLTTLWVSVIICIQVISTSPYRHLTPRLLSIAAYLTFTFSYSGTWNKDFTDSFFTDPGMTPWATTVTKFRLLCDQGISQATIELGSSSFVMSCSIVD